MEGRDVKERQEKIGPHVTLGHSKELGACNSCDRHAHEWGSTDHAVYSIDFGNNTVRVCEQCRKKLIEELSEFGRKRGW